MPSDYTIVTVRSPVRRFFTESPRFLAKGLRLRSWSEILHQRFTAWDPLAEERDFTKTDSKIWLAKNRIAKNFEPKHKNASTKIKANACLIKKYQTTSFRALNFSLFAWICKNFHFLCLAFYQRPMSRICFNLKPSNSFSQTVWTKLLESGSFQMYR